MESGSESEDDSDYEGAVVPNGIQMYTAEEQHANIYSRFQKRECCQFVPRSNSPRICCCNRRADWHASKAAAAAPDSSGAAAASAPSRPARPPPKRWSVSACTATAPTDAFGVLHFENFEFTRLGQNAKYIRLDCLKPSPRLLWKLLTKAWRIPEPELIVSVTGGAKKMRPMSDKIIKKLRQGIINIATKTKTWIVTGGFNLGTNKLVGEAIRDYQLAGGSERDVVLIGVCPWGSVRDKECLLVSEDKSLEGDLPVSTYRNPDNGDSVKGQAVLEPHHTHFLLCDDGTDSQFGSEIDFRASFEKNSAEQMQRRRNRGDGDLRSVTPCVHLIIEGGRKDVQAALVSAQSGAPVVVVKGSGRAANLIAFISENSEVERYEIEALTEEHFSAEFEPDSDEMRELVDWLMKLAEPECERMLNVYDAESMDPNEQLDRVILTAFLRQTTLSAVTQLNLAMAWNRPDLAAQEIFSSERKAKLEQLKGGDLESSMLRALARNQTEFVALLFDHGINIGSLLNLETLAGLYSSLLNKHDPQMMRLREQLDYLSMPLTSWLMSESKTVSYPTSTESQLVHQERLLRSVGRYISAQSGGVLRSPYPRRDRHNYLAEDLLLWAIVVQRTDMARIIWRQSSDTIASALVSAMMLRNMKSLAESEGSLEASAQLAAAADSFEGLAAGVLATCYAQDKQKTLDTLVRRLPIWDGQTLLTLADQGECMEFMSQQAVQTKISDIWIAGSKTYLPLWRTLLCMLLPMLIPALIFDKWLLTSSPAAGDSGVGGVGVGSSDRQSGTRLKRSTVQPRTSSTRQSAERQQQLQQQGATPTARKSLSPPAQSSGGHIPNPNFIQCVVIFYTSPQVKFISSMASAVVFLLLFSYVTLVTLKHPSEGTDEEPQPSVLEFVLIGWMFSLIAEEVRQIFDRNKVSVIEKLKDWFAHAWDVFDFTLNLMMIACILVRVFIGEEYFVWVRMTYALTLTLFYIRFMQFYLIHQALGPKVVMVTRMINDIVFFFAILAVFLLAYGVAAQALLYPNSPLSWKLVKDIVYLPYWQMYGELQLDDIKGNDDKVSGSPLQPFNDTDGGEEVEAVHNPLVIVLFAFYMLITNVLLLNLLIAMFGHTFDQVQDSSHKVWAYSRYKLIFEYHHRPFLCHPLTLLCHIGAVFEYFWRVTCGRRNSKRNAFLIDYDPSTDRMLGAFVQQGTDKYLAARRSEYAQPEDEEDTWLLALDRLDDVKYQMEHLEARLTASHRRKSAGGKLDLGSRSSSRLQLQLPKRQLEKQPEAAAKAASEDEPEPAAATAGIHNLSSRLQSVETKLSDILQAVEALGSSAASRRRSGSRKSKRKSRQTEEASRNAAAPEAARVASLAAATPAAQTDEDD